MTLATTPTIAQVLRDARALISTPERWTQGEMTRDESGFPHAEVLSAFDEAIRSAEAREVAA